jgi:hypothetical protein
MPCCGDKWPQPCLVAPIPRPSFCYTLPCGAMGLHIPRLSWCGSLHPRETKHWLSWDTLTYRPNNSRTLLLCKWTALWSLNCWEGSGIITVLSGTQETDLLCHTLLIAAAAPDFTFWDTAMCHGPRAQGQYYLMACSWDLSGHCTLLPLFPES